MSTRKWAREDGVVLSLVGVRAQLLLAWSPFRPLRALACMASKVDGQDKAPRDGRLNGSSCLQRAVSCLGESVHSRRPLVPMQEQSQ